MIIPSEQPHSNFLRMLLSSNPEHGTSCAVEGKSDRYLVLHADVVESAHAPACHKICEFLRESGLVGNAVTLALSACLDMFEQGRNPDPHFAVVYHAHGHKVSIGLVLEKPWEGCRYVVTFEHVRSGPTNIYDTVLDDRRRKAVDNAMEHLINKEDRYHASGVLQGRMDALEAAITAAKSGGRVPSVIDALSELLGHHEELLTKIRITRSDDGIDVQFEDTPSLDDLDEAVNNFADVTEGFGTYIVARAVRNAAIELDNGAEEINTVYKGYEVIGDIRDGANNEHGDATKLISVNFTKD